MPAEFTIDELSKLLSFKLDKEKLSNKTHLINTDTRSIQKGEIFLPLTGENFNGHDFINEAFSNGATFSFCERDFVEKVDNEHRKNLIFVNNSLDAYHKLANYYRNKINPIVIAITGSSGKTTIKDLIASVLSVKYKTHKTKANFNNEIGIPKTILEMPHDTKVLVLELAMREKGEIDYLSKTAEPDIAIITNVGSAHIGKLGSLEEIVRAKCELFNHTRKTGKKIVYDDKKIIQCLKSKGISDFETFGKEGEGKEKLNKDLVFKIAKHLGLSDDEIREGLSKYKIPMGRGNVIPLENNVYVIDETYNASPETVKEAVKSLLNDFKDYNQILVLGKLAELGKEEKPLIEDLVKWLQDKHLADIITIGNQCRDIPWNVSVKNVEDINEACAILDKLLVPKSVVLVKGSRVAGLEKIVDYLTK